MTGNWISVLAQLPPAVLAGLSSRILARIPRIHFGPILSKEELSKLAQATSISASQSQILVDGLTEFFRSAAFASKRPLQLTKELRESSADIPDEQLGVLVEAWTKEGASVIRAMKVESSSLTGGVWVDNVSWELGVCLASSSSSSSPPPPTPSTKGVLNLDLRDFSQPNCSSTASSSTPSSTSSTREDADRLSLEFDHRQLYDLYSTLETIQERMDALGK